MTIEFHPSALEGVITGPYAEKRLKRRTGELTCNSCEGLKIEGYLMELYELALAHDSGHAMLLLEHCCRQGLIR